MIGCITPSASQLEETISTIKYAHQATVIKNRPKRNIDENVTKINSLEQELKKMTEQLKKAN